MIFITLNLNLNLKILISILLLRSGILEVKELVPYFVSKNSFINKLIMIEVIEIKNGNKIFFLPKTNIRKLLSPMNGIAIII